MWVTTDSEFKMAPTKWRAFCKEFESKVINWYLENGKNFNETARNFQIDEKQVRNWLKDKEKIRFLKRLRKSCQYGRAKLPLMKKELNSKFLDIHKKGQRFKRWWFDSKTRDLVKKKKDPDEVFKLLHRWFKVFSRRHKIPLRRKSHAAKMLPAALRNTIENFHVKS